MTTKFTVKITKDGTNWQTVYDDVAVDATIKQTILGDVDKFGIKKFYPTSTINNQEWFVDMADPVSTPCFTNLPTITMVDEIDDIGGLKAFQTSADQVRMEANSVAGKKSLNVEITGYRKWVSGTNTEGRLFQDYGGRGGHHSNSTTTRACWGSAYKACLNSDGKAEFRKEVNHPAYCGDKATLQATTKTLLGHWIGQKLVIYNLPKDANGKIYPKLEYYIDDGCDNAGKLVIKGNETRWRKVTEYVDKGGWSTSDSDFVSTCPPLDSNYVHQYRQRDEIFNTSGSVGLDYNCIGVYRTDGITARWKYLSAREITPPV